MAALPETDVFRGAVGRELRSQFIRSMKRKVLMLTVAVIAIGVVVGLDKLKVQLVDAREKPYLAADVTRAIGKKNSELAAAAEKLRQDRRYADADAVFAALLAQTTYAADAAAQQAKIRAAYRVRIRELDRSISAAIDAPPPDAEGSPDGADKTKPKTPALAALKTRRAELAAVRAAELNEEEQSAADKTATLRSAFDETNVAETARSNFRVSKNPRVSGFVEHVVDPAHPLSIVYDVLWYAGLVIGVLAFVALLLTPLFKALPVTGAEEPIMDQVRSLFSRGPRGLGAGAVRIAAMTIGTAAIVSVATTAPSSPLVESALLTSSTIEEEAAEPQKVAEASKLQEQQKGTIPGETKPPDGDTSKETAIPTDPRLDELLGSVKELAAESASHKQALDDQGKSLEKLTALPEKVEKLGSDEQEQIEQLENYFEATDDAIEKAKKAAEIANARAVLAESSAATAGAQLGEAREYLEKRANAIDEGIALPYKVGERSGFLTSVLSFERYRVTAASVTFVEKAGAPEEVVAAMRSLKGAGDMSNDALRLALRQQLCGGPTNCDLHVAWRDIVLRAARRQ